MTTDKDKSIRLAQLKHAQRVAAALRKKNPRRVKTSGEDRDAAQELELFIMNDADLHRQQLTPIRLNLLRKYAAGKYDGVKAPKLWEYLAESGAQKYVKEFGGGHWFNVFTPETRRYAARQMAGSFEQAMKAGEYDHLITEKGGVHAKRLAALRQKNPRKRDPKMLAELHKGVYYFPTRAKAKAFAESSGYPTDRIIEYGRGFAVQGGVSGDYAGPHGLKVGDWKGVKKNPEYIDMDELPDRSGRTVPVDEKTRKILRVGMVRRGHKIISFHPPPDFKPASSGHVTTSKGHYYISVIGGEFIKPVQLVKNPRKRRAAKKNPDGPYVIALYTDAGARLTYDDHKKRFTDNSLPALYRTQVAAVERGEWLVKSNAKLRRYEIKIEPAKGKERGAVYGARPVVR